MSTAPTLLAIALLGDHGYRLEFETVMPAPSTRLRMIMHHGDKRFSTEVDVSNDQAVARGAARMVIMANGNAALAKMLDPAMSYGA